MISRLRERRSHLAVWSARLAALSIPVLILAAVLRRARLIDVAATYGAMALGFTLAALAVITAIAAFVAIWRDGRAGAGAALRGFAVGALVLAIPAVGAWKVAVYPRLTDVSTDPRDPPQYAAAHAARGGDDAAIVDPNADAVAAQEDAYPDIVPRHYPVGTARVFQEARAIVDGHGWKVLASRAPSEIDETGRIEAVATTPIFGFRQDVVIVMLPAGDGTLVHMRSAARNAAHDLGANAERIRDFFIDLDKALIGVGPA